MIDICDILLVEDDPYNAELTLHCLKKFNPSGNYLLLTDGAQALDYVLSRGAYSHRNANTNPKLILLDLKLLKVNGIQLLRAIKSHAPTRLTPTVILTSSADSTDIRQCYESGANSYIVKPVDYTEYCRIIVQLGEYWLHSNQLPPLEPTY